MLPLTMDMTELNGNEKYFDLAESFPANPSNPEKINVGDLLLYGSKNIGALLQAIFIDIDPMGHQATPIR